MFREKVDKKELNKFIKTSNKVLQLIYILVFVLVVLLVTYVIKEWKVLDFIFNIIKVISPVFIGLVIAWLLDPLVTKMEKKMNRVVACILTYLILIIMCVLLCYFVIPSFATGVTDLVNALPSLIDKVKNTVDNFFAASHNSLIAGYEADIITKIETIGKNATETLPTLLIKTISKVISGGATILLGFMIGFYILFDFKKVEKHTLSFIPDIYHDNAKDLMRRINGKLRNYVQGVLIVMFFVFLTQAIGLTLSGIKAPLLFALFCAATDVIPYIGPWIGALPAVLVGFSMNPRVGILTIISIMVCQTLENNFYQPLIMGKTMKLHPVTIRLGLLIFNYFFGMIGMIVATPVIASLKIIFEFIDEKTGLGEKFHSLNKKEVID